MEELHFEATGSWDFPNRPSMIESLVQLNASHFYRMSYLSSAVYQSNTGEPYEA